MSEKLSEYANYELGEAFFQITAGMVISDGVPFSRAGDFEIVSKSWRKLANKQDKTQEEVAKIDNDYKNEIIDLADSCVIYMSAKTGNKAYKFNLEDYRKFIGIFYSQPADVSLMDVYNKKIEVQFKKIANHGEDSGDNLIDNKDIAAYIYALDMKTERDENDKFKGFMLNGTITPINYAVAYQQLKEDADNMISFKLRQAYNNLFGG